jgi:hypothetical protein
MSDAKAPRRACDGPVTFPRSRFSPSQERFHHAHEQGFGTRDVHVPGALLDAVHERIVLKVATVALIGGGIFSYYLRDLRGIEQDGIEEGARS